MNASRTNDQNCAETDPGTRSALRDLRRRHGAETPIGHCCSNLLEQLENLGGSQSRDQRAQLRQNIAWQIASLAALTAGGDRR